MIDRLYWPVPIEDCCKWSDQKTVEAHRSFLSTTAAVEWFNSARHQYEQRVIPGSLRCEYDYTRAMVSEILWKVNRIKFHTAAILKDSTNIWHERFQLCNNQHINGRDEDLPSDEDIRDYLLQGIPKPWNLPIAYVRDGSRIVLIRSMIVEEYLKRHLVKLFYGNNHLIVDLGCEKMFAVEYVAKSMHSARTKKNKEEQK